MALFWSKYTPLETSVSSTDPLGFDYIAQQLGYEILPNYTTRTSRARYYSMVCFGLWMTERALHRQKESITDSKVKELFASFEKYWALAVATHYKGQFSKVESGLRGKQGAQKAYLNDMTKLDETFRLMARQLELGALGAYRTSLEWCELIKEGSLALTSKGRELAETFLPVGKGIFTQYQELIITSLLKKEAVQKYGNVSLESLGNYAKLDFEMKEIPEGEKALLREALIDQCEITRTTASLCVPYRTLFQEDTFAALEKLASLPSSNAIEKKVIESFQTLLAFERVSERVNHLYCQVILSIHQAGGAADRSQVLSTLGDQLEELINQSFIQDLLQSPIYEKMRTYFYAEEFTSFMNQCRYVTRREEILQSILTYHEGVMKKRRTSAWVERNGSQFQVNFGVDFARQKGDRVHTFKIGNLFQLISDTGWKP